MFRGIAVSLAALLLCAGFALGQNTPAHLMGDVTALKPDMVTIKTQTGKSEMVMLEKTTKYMMHAKPAKSSDLKIGESIMINATMDAKTKRYAAEEITLDAKDNKGKTATSKK